MINLANLIKRPVNSGRAEHYHSLGEECEYRSVCHPLVVRQDIDTCNGLSDNHKSCPHYMSLKMKISELVSSK